MSTPSSTKVLGGADDAAVAAAARSATLFAVSQEMTELVRTGAASLTEWAHPFRRHPGGDGTLLLLDSDAYTNDFEAPVVAVCWTWTLTGMLLSFCV